MDTVRLGASNLRVSRLCLGTMIFGSQLDEVGSHAVLDEAEGLGFDFIDCADVYPVPATDQTWGRSEEIVGRWLRGRRERFVVATKFGNRVGPQPAFDLLHSSPPAGTPGLWPPATTSLPAGQAPTGQPRRIRVHIHIPDWPGPSP